MSEPEANVDWYTSVNCHIMYVDSSGGERKVMLLPKSLEKKKSTKLESLTVKVAAEEVGTSGNFPAGVSAESISPNFPVKIGLIGGVGGIPQILFSLDS